MGRIGLTLWFALCTYMFIAFGHYLVHVFKRLAFLHWNSTALFTLLLAFISVLAGLRLLVLTVMLLLGYTTPRLARRDFRNSIANALFFIRTGGMIKDP